MRVGDSVGVACVGLWDVIGWVYRPVGVVVVLGEWPGMVDRSG